MNDEGRQSGEQTGRERELSETIRNYLRDHPNSMDTLEGIAYFWVMRQKVKNEVYLLQRVLAQLTAAGVLERIGEGQKALYRLSRVSGTDVVV